MQYGFACVHKELVNSQGRSAARIPAYVTVAFSTTFYEDHTVGLHFETPAPGNTD